MERSGGINGGDETVNKKLKNCEDMGSDGQDRISNLPDSVLIHILSFLPIKDAVRTVALQRFGYLWASIHSIDFQMWAFDDSDDDDEKTVPVEFIHNFLILHESPVINKFRLLIDMRPEEEPDASVPDKRERLHKEIDTWILFAVRRKIKVLELNFVEYAFSYGGTEYRLPNSVFSCGSLTELVLMHGRIALHGRVNNRCLKKLCLSYVKLSEDTIEEILHGCPLIEELSISRCSGTNKLIVKSEFLKAFKYYEGCQDVRLGIFCPSITSLDIEEINYVNVGPLPNVTFVELDVAYIKYQPSEFDYVRKLLQSLHCAKAVRIGWTVNLVLSLWEVTNVPCIPCPSFSWKSLEVTTYMDRSCIPGIVSLMRNCKQLESLDIFVCRGINSELEHNKDSVLRNLNIKEENFWDCQQPYPCLKTVKISGCVTKPRVLEFVKFLLRSSVVLEKLVISSSDYPQDATENLYQNLVYLRSASPSVTILFNQREIYVTSGSTEEGAPVENSGEAEKRKNNFDFDRSKGKSTLIGEGSDADEGGYGPDEGELR